MWTGSWNADGTVYTGTYIAADLSAWVGTVTVLASGHTWTGVWHTSFGPV